MHPLGLEVVEERLHRRVVVHATFAVHTLDDPFIFQPLLILRGNIFCAAV